MPRKAFSNMKEFLEKTNKRVLGLIRLALRRAPPWLFCQETNTLKNCITTTSRSPPPSPAACPTSNAIGRPEETEHGPGWALQERLLLLAGFLPERWQAGPSAPQAVVNGWLRTLRGFFQSRMCTGNKFRKSCFLLQEMNPPPDW